MTQTNRQGANFINIMLDQRNLAGADLSNAILSLKSQGQTSQTRGAIGQKDNNDVKLPVELTQQQE